MGIFGKRVQTILNPNPRVKDELNLSTHSVFKIHSYIAKTRDISLTPSGKPKIDLPEKSNLAKMDRLLDRTCKTIPNCDVLVSNQNGVYKEMYTDTFGRFMASKIVDSYGLQYTLRGDIATNLTNQGNMFIQCERGMCSVFIPNEISVDFKKFAPKQMET